MFHAPDDDDGRGYVGCKKKRLQCVVEDYYRRVVLGGSDAEYGLGTVEHAKIVTVTVP